VHRVFHDLTQTVFHDLGGDLCGPFASLYRRVDAFGPEHPGDSVCLRLEILQTKTLDILRTQDDGNDKLPCSQCLLRSREVLATLDILTLYPLLGEQVPCAEKSEILGEPRGRFSSRTDGS
jgi:hypothetical protein